MTRDERLARIDDLAWMVTTGESAEGAARRLGITLNALEKWAANNAPDLWRQLRRRDPLPLDPLACIAVCEARGRVAG